MGRSRSLPVRSGCQPHGAQLLGPPKKTTQSRSLVVQGVLAPREALSPTRLSQLCYSRQLGDGRSEAGVLDNRTMGCATLPRAVACTHGLSVVFIWTRTARWLEHADTPPRRIQGSAAEAHESTQEWRGLADCSTQAGVASSRRVSQMRVDTPLATVLGFA